MNDISAYDAIKDLMNTGDCIEFQGTSIISKEIRARTGFDTNHSALVVVMQSPYTGIKRRYVDEESLVPELSKKMVGMNKGERLGLG